MCIFPFPSAPLSALQKHYRQLEAIALEHEEVEPVADLTAVDTGMISKRAGKLLSEFKELIYSADYDPDKKPAAKRKVLAPIYIIIMCMQRLVRTYSACVYASF